jgi:probable rRNA maturation factor
MANMVEVSAEGVRVPISGDRVRRSVDAALRAMRVRNAMISVAYVSRATIARLNRRHLGHSGPTDVISFGFARGPDDSPVIGDIYIAPDVVRENARAHGSGVREEHLRVLVHGTLHVLGHDHPDDESRTDSEMWRKQERIVRTLLEESR